jgi:hypothetical protein
MAFVCRWDVVLLTVATAAGAGFHLPNLCLQLSVPVVLQNGVEIIYVK